MIIEKIYEEKAKKIKAYPCHVNRASNLGDPCIRRLVYERTHWQERLLHDVHLQLLFDEGNNQEKIVVRDLQDAGFEIYEQQRSFEIKDLQITGHMDLKLKISGDETLYPTEIKSMAPHIFQKVNQVLDFYNKSYPWLQKYPPQLLLYMYASDEERGVWILKNKSTGALKEIWVDFDYDLVDEIFCKAQVINEHIENKTMPDRIEDLELCARCPFRHICLPERDFGKGIIIEDDETLTEMIDRLEDLKESYSEYISLNKKITESVKEKDNFIVGNRYHITGKWIDVKERIQYAYKYWKKNIIKIA